MIGATIQQAKGQFFDRLALETAAEKAEAKVMSKFGSFVRRTARSSIRSRQKRLADMTPFELAEYGAAVNAWKRDGEQGPRPKRFPAASKPGNPPNNQTGLLKKFIFFTYESFRRSVIIGPALLNNAGKTLNPQGKTVPQVLEEGGPASVTYLGWEHGRRVWKTKAIHIEPRPYMKPAYDANLSKVPGLWRDSIKP